MADNKNDQIEKINKELEELEDIYKALETEEKKINAIIKYFNWLEEKENEEFTDNKGDCVKRITHKRINIDETIRLFKKLKINFNT